MTINLPTPTTAMYGMEEGEHRLLRGKKGSKKRHVHSIFGSSEDKAPETQAPETQTPTKVGVPDIVLPGASTFRIRFVSTSVRYNGDFTLNPSI